VYTTGNQTIGGTKTFSSFIKLGFTIGIDFLVEDSVADPVTISLEPENGGTAGNKVATIPNATGTLVTTGAYNQTIGGAKTFSSNVIIPNASADTHALNRITADGRYARLGAGNTFSGSNEYTGLNTFYFGNLLLRNTGDTGSATINYGTASVNRTYTFAGDSGTVWTNGNLPITNAGPGSNTPTTRLVITLSGVQYRFDVQQL
jgi:hypothetical protein